MTYEEIPLCGPCLDAQHHDCHAQGESRCGCESPMCSAPPPRPCACGCLHSSRWLAANVRVKL